MQKVTIWKTNNGYIVKMPDPNSDGDYYEVFQADGDDFNYVKQEASALAQVCWKVIDALAPVEISSRYSAHRVRVVIEPGDKYEDGLSED